MPGQTCEANQSDLARIDSLVKSTRRTLRASWLLTGTLLTCGVAVATIAVAAGVDLLIPLSVPLRCAALLAVVLPTAWLALTVIVRPAIRRLSNQHVARRIERLVPEIQNRLVTALDIGFSNSSGTSSRAFRQRLVSETNARIANFRPIAVVDRTRVRRSVLFAAITGSLFAGEFISCFDRMPATLARIFLPTAAIPPATGVSFSARPGDTQCLKGDNVVIQGVVERGRLSDMSIEVRTESGSRECRRMQSKPDGQFNTTFTQLDKSVAFRLIGGRTWSRWHTITVVDRPTIANTSAVLHFPAYMKLSPRQMGQGQSVDVIGPVGSRVEIVADVAGNVHSGEIQLLRSVNRAREIANRVERIWFENKLPDGARTEGNWQWDYGVKFRVAHTEPPAAGAHSHGFLGAASGFELRPDDVIYAYVLIVAGQVPEQIMLQFHDGRDWEHRAFWGADKIQLGVPSTPSRVRMGEIPAAGSWLRLEVPAKSVGLENKKLYGISFMLFGGQCKWHRAGAVDPAALLEPDFDMESTVGMVRELAESTSSSSLADGPTRWNGSLLLSHNAFYRVHFQNQLGYANKPMQEARLTAIPDNPPQVALEKPGADIVLSQPQRVTLVVHASDDFGLSDVSWTAQKGDSGGFVGSPLIEYEDAVRSDTVVAALDLEPHQLKQGDFVRYRIQARDRKGQLAQTKEFVVRIQHDNNAADKQLASTAEQHETLRAKLEELVRRQTPIGESLADLAAREGGSTDRQGLSQLAAPQDANAQIGTQIRDQLQQASIQAANSNLVPDQIAAQMRLSEQLFQHDVLRPMHELVELMRQAADDQKPTPDVAAMSDSARRIQRQLETIQSRLQSLARAQQKMHDDPADAIDQLREELLTQNASLTGQELAELRDYLDRLAGRMKLLEGRENELAAQTRDAAPLLLPDVEKQQTQIESDAERLIAHAEAFMQSENARELTKESPQVDNHSEPTSGDPLGVLNERMGAKDRAKVETATQSGNEHGYTPTGVKKKLASRPASVPPNDRPKSGSLNGARNGLHDQPGQQAGAAESSSQNGALRAQLAQRQEQTSLRLHRSREQIEAPRDQIGLLIEQLSKALGANPGDDIGQLSRLMQSDNVRSAAQLAKAVRRLSPDEQPNVQSQQASPSGNAADTTGLLRNGVVSDFDDLDLDLATRAALLRMQPRVREELLKGMREAGPEPYRKLIEEYFNRLTKVKGPQ